MADVRARPGWDRRLIIWPVSKGEVRARYQWEGRLTLGPVEGDACTRLEWDRPLHRGRSSRGDVPTHLGRNVPDPSGRSAMKDASPHREGQRPSSVVDYLAVQ